MVLQNAMDDGDPKAKSEFVEPDLTALPRLQK